MNSIKSSVSYLQSEDLRVLSYKISTFDLKITIRLLSLSDINLIRNIRKKLQQEITNDITNEI